MSKSCVNSRVCSQSTLIAWGNKLKCAVSATTLGATTLAFQVSCSQSYIYQNNDRNCQKLLEIRNFTTYKKRTCQKKENVYYDKTKWTRKEWNWIFICMPASKDRRWSAKRWCILCHKNAYCSKMCCYILDSCLKATMDVMAEGRVH